LIDDADRFDFALGIDRLSGCFALERGAEKTAGDFCPWAKGARGGVYVDIDIGTGEDSWKFKRHSDASGFVDCRENNGTVVVGSGWKAAESVFF